MPTRTFTPLDMSPFSVCSAGSTTETIQVSPDVFLTTKDFHEILVGRLDHYLLSVRKKNKKKEKNKFVSAFCLDIDSAQELCLHKVASNRK